MHNIPTAFLVAVSTLFLASLAAPTALLPRIPVVCFEDPTLSFTPYEATECTQSDSAPAPQLNLTQGFCQDSPYPFLSFFIDGAQQGALGAAGNCELALYPQASCRGDVVVQGLLGDSTCDVLEPQVPALSVLVTCS